MRIADWDWTSEDDDRPLWDRVVVGLRDCAFLGPETGVRKRGLVSLNVGWLARGGLLRLFADRVEFEPNPLERLLRARGRTIAFSDLEWIERRPARPEEISPIGEAQRMRFHLRDGTHLDILPAGNTLDVWLLAIRESYAWWFRRARAEEPDQTAA